MNRARAARACSSGRRSSSRRSTSTRGKTCGGCQIHVLDRQTFRPVLAGVALIRELPRGAPDQFAWRDPPYEYEHDKMPIDILAGSPALREQIEAGSTPSWSSQAPWEGGVEEFVSSASRTSILPVADQRFATGARAADLLRMPVGVRGVDLEPRRDGVAARAPCACRRAPTPPRVSRSRISRRRPRAALNASSDASIGRVVVQPPRELVLVVADDQRVVASATSRRSRIADVISLSAR